MVRRPTPKRRLIPTPQRDEELHALSFKLPAGLVAEIDAIAAAEQRSRAKMIEIGMRQFVQSYGQKSAA